MFSANFLVKSLAMLFITINLFAAMQLWPAFNALPMHAFLAAKSGSASSRTMKGSEPPSSSTKGFRLFPAVLPTFMPAVVLPVSEAAWMQSDSKSPETISCSAIIVLKTFSGKPDSMKDFSMAKAHSVTLLACFSMHTFPASKAGTPNLIACQNGKFQGMIERIVPRGSKEIICFFPSACSNSSFSQFSPFSA